METVGVWPGTITLPEYDALGEETRIEVVDGVPVVSLDNVDDLAETPARIEVVDGVPVVSPEPSILHQRISHNLAVLLDEAAAPDLMAVGPVDWVLREVPLTVRAPDVVVMSRALIGERRLTSPPILAVEVLSADSLERDVVTKRRQYAEAGLDHYWVVAPDPPQLVVYRRSPAGSLDEAARATGDDALTVTDPFPLTLRPLDLVR